MTNSNNTLKPLTEEEIMTILLAADEIIMYGGKGLLGKILGGSKDKRIFTSELHHSPAYGTFKGTTQKEIMEKVDWMFQNGYLAADDKLSLLLYTEKGWEKVREELATMLYTDFINAAEYNRYDFIDVIGSQPMDLRTLLLEKIKKSGDRDLIEMLNAWLNIGDEQPIPEMIHDAIQILDQGSHQSTEADKVDNDGAISFDANKKWLAIPAEIRQQLIRNVLCGHCKNIVQIEKYIIKNHRNDIVLEGKCKTCGNKVARVID